jgi:hypothetical protein
MTTTNNDNDAELYGILIAIEKMEEAYACDNITNGQYEELSRKLIAQFQILHNSLGNPNLMEFANKNKMNCKAAITHILATDQVVAQKPLAAVQKPKAIAEIVQHYITAIDVLKLKMNTVDVIFPSLKEIVNLMETNKGFESATIRKWFDILSKLPANAELITEQTAQLALDLECAYADLHKFLSTL